jgi:hypothetical protein
MPDDLVTFIAKATAKHPDDRYASCGEAAQALRTAAERPLVEHFELLGLAISYHPSLRERVEAAVTVLEAELTGVTGVKLGRWNVPGTDTPTQD